MWMGRGASGEVGPRNGPHIWSKVASGRVKARLRARRMCSVPPCIRVEGRPTVHGDVLPASLRLASVERGDSPVESTTELRKVLEPPLPPLPPPPPAPLPPTLPRIDGGGVSDDVDGELPTDDLLARSDREPRAPATGKQGVRRQGSD